MNKKEELMQIGDAILSPKAISFIETMQYENNDVVESYCKMINEQTAGLLILLNEGSVSDELKDRLIKNAGSLSTLAIEMEKLQKP